MVFKFLPYQMVRKKLLVRIQPPKEVIISKTGYMDIRDFAKTERKMQWINSLKVFLDQGSNKHSHNQRKGFIGTCIYRFNHQGFPIKLMSQAALERRQDRESKGLRPMHTSDHVYSINKISEYLIYQFDGGFKDWDEICEELPFLLTTIEVSPNENNRLGVSQRGPKKYNMKDLFNMKHYKDLEIRLVEIPDKLKKDGTPKKPASYYDAELRTPEIKELILW
jgi:hypothetical protein|tara:strand:- start:4008 stop:4673 length:666 start_codon:yes stop_codon:yes gene_type:complete